MQFLALNETQAWCAGHAYSLTPENWPELPGSASFRTRLQYAEGGRSGREAEVAAQCVEALGRWEECLLWVIGWGVWPSGEDWPTYYAARGRHGESRSLDEAPGHLFGASEKAELHGFLTLVLENAWDAVLLPAVGSAHGKLVAMVSHDEFIDVCVLEPETSEDATGRP